MTLLDKFESYTIDNIPQKDNRHVDAMEGVASLIYLEDIFVDFTFIVQMILKPSIDYKIK
jgi:hypothetical protein